VFAVVQAHALVLEGVQSQDHRGLFLGIFRFGIADNAEYAQLILRLEDVLVEVELNASCPSGGVVVVNV